MGTDQAGGEKIDRKKVKKKHFFACKYVPTVEEDATFCYGINI
jgi:hypothetical protein